MTVPATGWPDAGTRAPLRTFDWRVQARGIGGLLVAGLALRLILAYLLPGSGFGVDITAFRFWANDLAQHGPLGFYGRGFFADYTPGYLYVLWMVGVVGQLLGGIGDLIKVPPILADLAIGWLIWRMVLDLGGSSRRALIAAAVYLFNPITWFDSVVWGQVDSFGVVFLLLGVRDLWRDRPERSAVWAVVAAIIKPQLGILVPIVAAVTIRRYFIDWRRRAGASGQGASHAAGHAANQSVPETADVPGSPEDRRGWDRRGWDRRERGPVRVVTTAITGLLTATVLCLPFGLTIVDLARQIVRTAGGYPYLTVNAYNPWALLQQAGNGLAANGLWVRDLNGPNAGEVGFTFGPIPAVVVGTVLLLVAVLVVSVLVARRPDRLTVLVGLTVLGIAFFVVPTRVHERYMFPVFALGAILLAFSIRWTALYVALAIATFANMYVVLTTLYPDNPGISDWLGIGPDIRAATTVTLIAIVNLAGFVWAALQLDGRSREMLAAEVARGAEPAPGGGSGARAGLGRASLPSGGAATRRALPTGTAASAFAAEDGGASGSVPAGAMPATVDSVSIGWRPDPQLEAPSPDATGLWPSVRRAVFARPLRADRSKVLGSEPRGRLDRLDLWLFVVLIIGTLTLRTFRLSEPYMMHFDEVYHARTATEFLQFWRYGIPHDIYEYTHPHLAKYMMAGGLVAVGDNPGT
ncbi:MAG TPA: hypothetical protein VNF73_05520, partial [Candidatus Saccharimonadales bacterium]|nr:hypothetical protein [Candidatus Saccharimonadales bacterium]